MSETPRFKRKALNLANADGSFLTRSASCLIVFSQVRLTVETWIRFLPRAPLKRQICLGGRLELRRRRRASTYSARRRRRTSTALPARALFIYPGRFSSPQTAPAPWPYNSRYRECPRPRSSGGCTGADAFPYNLRLYGIKSALSGPAT